jgi:DNA-3-methyladenine glycosylase II
MSLLNKELVAEAGRYLSSTDHVLAAVIEQVGELHERPKTNGFKEICGIVVSQQLSGKAADTILNRLEKATQEYGGFHPEAILRMPDATLRKTGLSKFKSGFVQGIASCIKQDPNWLQSIEYLNDEAAISQLTRAKGIGLWTANLYLISYHGRINVYPHGDGTLIRAIRQLYAFCPQNDPQKYSHLVSSWKPYRSVAARYLWSWIDMPSRE